MAKPDLKLQAIDLRRKGKSIKEIATSLGVSKGSVSVWCQDIKLTQTQSKRLKQRQIASGSAGRQVGANKNREKRLRD
jgi:transposase